MYVCLRLNAPKTRLSKCSQFASILLPIKQSKCPTNLPASCCARGGPSRASDSYSRERLDSLSATTKPSPWQHRTRRR
ncbi:hypothetical protein LSAT2_016570 [Lamellibrachia satsuma]|nr:hypothetical protein LSAT2_016570 [Lamellibrachia satsuma]